MQLMALAQTVLVTSVYLVGTTTGRPDKSPSAYFHQANAGTS